jgi:protein JSN1
LWVGSIPANTTPGTLLSIFSPFGAVESARVLTNKQCGFVNFETITSAIAARTALNGREILGSEVGAVKIGFAKIPVKVTSVEGGVAGGPSSDQVSQADSGVDMYSALKELKGSSKLAAGSSAGGVENYGSNLVLELLQKGVHDEIKSFKASGSVAGASDAGSSKERSSDSGITEQQMIMMVLSQGDPAMAEDVLAIAGEHARPAALMRFLTRVSFPSRTRKTCTLLQLHPCHDRTLQCPPIRRRHIEGDTQTSGHRRMQPSGD